ncbi:MAG: hypothetical protein HDQ88_06905 [Clostridia bacterium]|nr:hypothetical protein [Clostridia bacterium]
MITECLTYPYSKEAYDIQKDIYEAALTEQALVSMQFREDNEDAILESGMDDVFIESSKSKKEKSYNSFSSKKSGVWGKIVNGLKSLISKVINFFASIGDKFSSQEIQIRKIRNFLATAPASNGIADRIEDDLGLATLKSAEKAKTSNASVGDIIRSIINSTYRQPDEIAFGKFSSEFDEATKKVLTVALSTSKVRINPSFLTNTVGEMGKGAGVQYKATAASAEDIARYLSKFNMGKGEYKSLMDALSTDAADAARDGITITVSGNSLKRAIASLKKSRKTLEQASTYITKKVAPKNENSRNKSKLSDTTKYDEQSTKLNEANGAFMRLKVMIGNTLKLYKSLVSLRDNIIKKLYKYVSKKGAKAVKEVRKEEKRMGVEKNQYARESVFDDLLDDSEDYTEGYEEDFDDSEFADMFD